MLIRFFCIYLLSRNKKTSLISKPILIWTCNDHMPNFLNTSNDLVVKIDFLSSHPKRNSSFNNVLFHLNCLGILTITDLSKTWVLENLEIIVSPYVRELLELPINAIFSFPI